MIDKYDSCLSLFPGETDWGSAVEKLKPGAYIAAVCPTLEHHTIAAAIEDSGVEIRDCLLFLGQPSYMVALGRVPVEGTVAQNVLKYGTGGINVGMCRVPVDVIADKSQLRTINRNLREGGDGWGLSTSVSTKPQVVHEEGRWPANLLHDGGESVKKFFPITGVSSGGHNNIVGMHGFRGGKKRPQEGAPPPGFGDCGSAARFFFSVSDEDKVKGLVTYLARLICPPNGKVLALGVENGTLNNLGFEVFHGI